MQKQKRPDTRRISLAAVLAASAALISISGLSVPFPLMPFLRFDAAEIPDALAFLLLGPSGGLAVTTIHWLMLNLSASFDPVIGPTMKFMAVFATMLGMYIGSLFVSSNFSSRRNYSYLLVWGTILRFIIMIPVTFVLYYIIFPSTYLSFASQALRAIGIDVTGALAIAIIVTLITGLFNIIHAIITITGSWIIYRGVQKSGALNYSLNWIGGQMKMQYSSKEIDGRDSEKPA
ncbi:MAG: hypothetical protein QXT39_04630 [Conexivisphaerales archaeon]